MNTRLKKYKFRIFTILFGHLVTCSSWGLVDYSSYQEQGSGASSSEGSQLPLNKSSEKNRSTSFGNLQKKANRSQTKYIELTATYDHLKMRSQQGSAFQKYLLEAHFRPLTEIFLDLSYWQAATESEELSAGSKGRFSPGNPKAIIGVNWLQLGSSEDKTMVDFYGGASFAENKSPVASSRLDKIVGVQTYKQISELGIGLSGELRLTGEPENEKELGLGPILKLGLGVGWIATPDIRMTIEAYNYRIKESSRTHRSPELSKKISNSVVAPKIYLNILPRTELHMGLFIRTRSTDQDSQLINAKLYDYPGLYGNSFLLGLNFSI